MTTNPLLTADEAARLVPGEQLVIVRPGDEALHGDWLPDQDRFVAPQDWVALTGPCPTCDGVGSLPGDRCWNPDCRDGRRIVPLYSPGERDLEAHPPDQDGRCIYDCPEHDDDDRVLAGRGSIEIVPMVAAWSLTMADQDRIVIAVPKPDGRCVRYYDDGSGNAMYRCEHTGPHDGLHRAGGALPVTWSDDTFGADVIPIPPPSMWDGDGWRDLCLDPLPVPGRDFGIVIDCVEVV